MEAQNGAQVVADPTGATPMPTGGGAVAETIGATGGAEGSPASEGSQSGGDVPALPDGFDITQLPQVRELQSSMDRQIQDLRTQQEQQQQQFGQREAHYQEQLAQTERLRQEYLQLQMAGMTDSERAEAMSGEYQRQNQELQARLQQIEAQQEQQRILSEMSALSGMPVTEIPTSSYFDATQAVLGHVSNAVSERDQQIAAMRAELESLTRGNKEAQSLDLGTGLPSTPSNTLQQQYNQTALAVRRGQANTNDLAAIKDQAMNAGVTLDYMAWMKMKDS